MIVGRFYKTNAGIYRVYRTLEEAVDRWEPGVGSIAPSEVFQVVDKVKSDKRERLWVVKVLSANLTLGWIGVMDTIDKVVTETGKYEDFMYKGNTKVLVRCLEEVIPEEDTVEPQQP